MSGIEREGSDPELLAELALPRNAIVKRNPDSTLSGTGPFHIVDWQPGKKLTLAADENCWRGRPFLDAIEIEMGKSFRDQMTALELMRWGRRGSPRFSSGPLANGRHAPRRVSSTTATWPRDGRASSLARPETRGGRAARLITKPGQPGQDTAPIR